MIKILTVIHKVYFFINYIFFFQNLRFFFHKNIMTSNQFESFESFYNFAIQNANPSPKTDQNPSTNLSSGDQNKNSYLQNSLQKVQVRGSLIPNPLNNSKNLPFHQHFVQSTENIDFINILLELDTFFYNSLQQKSQSLKSELEELERQQFAVLEKAATGNKYTIEEVNELNQKMIMKREHTTSRCLDELVSLRSSIIQEFRQTVVNLNDPKVSDMFFKSLQLRMCNVSLGANMNLFDESQQNMSPKNKANNNAPKKKTNAGKNMISSMMKSTSLTSLKNSLSTLTDSEKVISNSQNQIQKAQNNNNRTRLSSTSSYDTVSDSHIDRVDEHFSVSIGHQLKSTHNLRLLRGDILHTYGNYSLDLRQEERLRSFSTIYKCDPVAAFFVQETSTANYKIPNNMTLYHKIQRSSLKYPEYHFVEDYTPCRELILHPDKPGMDINDPRQHHLYLSGGPELAGTGSGSSLKLQRFSTLKEIDSIFWFESKRRDILKPLNQKHPILNHLKDAIKLATTNHFSKILIPILLTDQIDECMTLNWINERAEAVLKYVKGYLSEATVELKSLDDLKYRPVGLSVHFILPVNLNDLACQRVRSRLLEVYRTTAAV